MNTTPDLNAIRNHAKAILRALPPEENESDLAAVIRQIKELMPSVDAGPWFLGDIDDSEGYEFQTLGAHKPPHYEEMVAQFFPGNHGTAPADLILLLLNNLEAIVGAAERSLDQR